MTTIRSFIAVELTDEVRTALLDLQNRLKQQVPPRSVRWTPPQNIHLTLHFLGDVAAENIDKAAGALRRATAGYPPFTLRVGGLGAFSNLRRPRIIWTGVLGDTPTLTAVHQSIGQYLQMIDFILDERPFSPHLTLGRVNKRLPRRHRDQLSDALTEAEKRVGRLAELPVSRISLIKSELTPSGPIYTPLSQGKLKGSG